MICARGNNKTNARPCLVVVLSASVACCIVVLAFLALDQSDIPTAIGTYCNVFSGCQQLQRNAEQHQPLP